MCPPPSELALVQTAAHADQQGRDRRAQVWPKQLN